MVGCPWIYQQNTRIIQHVYDFMALNIMIPLGIKVNDKLPHILISYVYVFSPLPAKGNCPSLRMWVMWVEGKIWALVAD